MAKSAADRRELGELAERMVRVLESQRPLGGNAYPPTLRRLAVLCGLNESDPRVIKAVGQDTFKQRAVVAWNKDRKPDCDALAFLAPSDTLDEAVEGVAPAVLVALLKGAAETKTQALSVTKLRDKLTERLKKPFQAAIKRAIERRSLPPEVAWILINNAQSLFLTSALQPASPSPVVRTDGQANAPHRGFRDAPHLFAAAFRATFDRLDRENRSANIVRLLDLRRALPQFDREQFDAGLRRLRLDDEFTLSGHEGRHGPLTDEEREAGVREAGSLLVYASRRT
jgi:hypothetical protein